MEEKAKQKSDSCLLRFFIFPSLEIYFLVLTIVSLTYVSCYNSEGTLEDSLGFKIGFFLYMACTATDFTEIGTLLTALILKHHCP